MKNNISNNGLPTLDEIKLFHEGGLRDDRKAAIESQAAENPLLAEALEGFSAMPLYDSVPDAGSMFNESGHAWGGSKIAAATTGATVTGIAAAAKSFASWWSVNSLIIAVSIVATGVSTYVIVNKTNNNTAQVQQVGATANDDNNSQVIVPGDSETPGSANTSGQDGIAATQEKNQPTAEVSASGASGAALSGTSIEGAQNAQNTGEVITPSGDITQLTTHEPEAVPHSPSDAPAIAGTRTGMVAVNIKQVLHYKVADYTEIRNSQWQSFTPDAGVPAQYANDEEMKAAEAEKATKGISYMNYITECMQAMDQGRYVQAEEQFNIILGQYPDDVNAQFYMALSYYRDGQYEKALGFLDKTMKNTIRTFNEEAEYYKAKSLKSLGRMDEANDLFTRIVQKDKFYAGQALKELE